ncbi:MAG: SMC-Scp complex subunit ScpB [Tissierellia bacterium]|nr:SMC-Scp complex subunit ScpB [Tissierellia bacterium]
MRDNYLIGLIEEILYIWGDMISIDQLAKILETDKKSLKENLQYMYDDRNNKKSGLILKRYDDSYQLTTRKEHDKYIQKILSNNSKKLGNSALETLSIIAYRQPITRAEIDNIRGVNSQASIDSLLEKNLIEKAGRLDKIGKPILYKTTNDFLKYFDIESLDNLPDLPELGGEYED